MATTEIHPKADLGSLRIHDRHRSSGKAGKFLSYASAVLGLVVILAGLGYAFRNQTPAVEVVTAQKPEIGGAILNASGYVTPRRRATIAAKITGRVTGVFFDEGTHVHQGQLLARLDDSDTRRRLDSATGDPAPPHAPIPAFQTPLRLSAIQPH